MNYKEFSFGIGDVSLSGIKKALVVDDKDPLCLERVRVRVLGVHDMENKDPENSIWAEHLAPSKMTSGEIPDIDDWLYVIFQDENEPMSCLWIGWVRLLIPKSRWQQGTETKKDKDDFYL